MTHNNGETQVRETYKYAAQAHVNAPTTYVVYKGKQVIIDGPGKWHFNPGIATCDSELDAQIICDALNAAARQREAVQS
jgi:hypothetical protein